MTRHQPKESGVVVKLETELCIEYARVPVAAAPQAKILTTEPLGHLDHLFDLRGRMADYPWIGVRCGAMHVLVMGEEIARAEEDADPRLRLARLKLGHHRVEVCLGLLDRGALWGHITVVEGEVVHAEFLVKGAGERCGSSDDAVG